MFYFQILLNVSEARNLLTLADLCFHINVFDALCVQDSNVFDLL